MPHELPFQLATFALVLAMKLARWPSRRRVGWRTSWPGMKQNPLDTAILLGWGSLVMAGLVLYAVWPGVLAWAHVPLPAWLRWTGVGAGAGALALLAWADRTLGKNLSVTLQLRDDHALVTSGPYRVVRHPIYLAGLAFFAAMFLVTANWLLGLAGVGGAIVLYAIRIPREERMMLGRFGDAYRDYVRRTGRWLPRLRR